MKTYHHPPNARALGLVRTLQGGVPKTKRLEPRLAPSLARGAEGCAQTGRNPGRAAGDSKSHLPPPEGREVARWGVFWSWGAGLRALGVPWSWGSHSSRGRCGQGTGVGAQRRLGVLKQQFWGPWALSRLGGGAGLGGFCSLWTGVRGWPI